MRIDKLKHEEISPTARVDVERALSENDPDTLLRTVLSVALHDSDWKYAQDLCLRLSQHEHFNVKANAILGFGHIARIHGQLDQALVRPIVASALTDTDQFIRGQAYDAKDDTEHFLGWVYDETESGPRD